MTTHAKHFFRPEIDRCVCGAEIVYYEGDAPGDPVGDGCEVTGVAYDGRVVKAVGHRTNSLTKF